MSEENDHVNMLKEKITLQDLGQGAVFEIDSLNFDAALETAKRKEEEYYCEDNLERNLEHLSISVLDEEEMKELQGTPGSTAFSTIALQMTDLHYGSNLKKVILRHGEGTPVPVTALVEVHYSAYFEFGDEPFDSTYLRGQSFKFIPSMGDCIAGLSLAVVSMKKREISQFLVHPDLGYGKLGVPPRIPPEAELLFQVEVLDFIDGVEGKLLGDLNDTGVEDVMKKANAKYLEGNNLYKKRNLTDAIVKYKKALSLIEDARQGNADDEKRRTDLMLKLCCNLALCHNKKQLFHHAAKMSRRALEIKPNHCKALFYLGRALLMISEFDAAKVELLKALKLEPTNADINNEIILLDKKMSEYQTESKQMSERMFMGQGKESGDTEDCSQQSKWTPYLKRFLNNGAENYLSLPIALTAEEMQSIETEATKLGLTVQTGSDKIIIKKKKVT